jgi:hypothetical protein
MRMTIGLDAPAAGTVTVNGRRYAEHVAPLREVGALLEARSVHPGRSAFDHLMALAYTHSIPRVRVNEVIELAGLQSVAGKRASAFSLGMIRSTLAAVPTRLPVLWAKATVYGILIFIISTLGAFAVFLASSAVLSGTSIAMSIAEAGVIRSLLGVGVYLGLVGVAGVALGALLRSTAGGISALVGTFLLVPGLMSLLPKSLRTDTTPYLPGNAGESIFALHPATECSRPLPGCSSRSAGQRWSWQERRTR